MRNVFLSHFQISLDSGKAELRVISEEDLTNADVIERLENASRMFFVPLSQLLSVEPDMR